MNGFWALLSLRVRVLKVGFRVRIVGRMVQAFRVQIVVGLGCIGHIAEGCRRCGFKVGCM